MLRQSLIFSLLCAAASLAPQHAFADDSGRVTVIEENDALTRTGDKHYTQGLSVSRLSSVIGNDDAWASPFLFLSNNTPIFEGGDYQRRFDWHYLGQSIFTPENLRSTSPAPADRPYGAWLYTGAGLLQESKHEDHNTLENTEVLAGVVGPMALGSLVQNDWHQLIGVAPAQGWENQLHNEPGLIMSYERKWRFEAPLDDYFSADAIPEAGASLGNVFTYGEASTLFRFGHNLGADYGPNHIRPSLSGTDWFDGKQMNGDFGWYIFAGTQARAVGHNVFLDGNTWRESPSVNKKVLVDDMLAGVSFLWSSRARFDFTYVQRSPEFDGQGHPDRFGSAALTIGF